jgi:septal ring factor EnvC (AmiA/AmiB activator)
MNEISKIKGVGPVLAKAFTKKGFVSIEKIAAGSVTDLATVSGVSEMRAKELIKAAKLLLKNLALTDAARKAKPRKNVKKPASKNNRKNGKLAKRKKLEKKLKAQERKIKKLEKKLEEINKKRKRKK